MRFYLLIASLALALPVSGQMQLEGQWEGSITLGGIHSSKGLPFELFLYRDGDRLWGRSYIRLEGQRQIIMDVEGYMYQDRSVFLQEVSYEGDEATRSLVPYFRQYELVFKRGLFEGSLNGFWQEVRDDALNLKRSRGRIFLRKATTDKA